MTELAFRCAMLELSVDPARIFYGGDPFFEQWLFELTDRLAQEHRRQATASKSKKRK